MILFKLAPFFSFLIVAILYFPASAQAARNKLAVSAVFLEDSGWTQEEISERLQQASAVYQQCDIQLEVSSIRSIALPTALTMTYSAEEKTISQIKSLLPRGLVKPVFIYTKTNAHPPQKELSDNSYTISKSFANNPNEQDVIWVFKDGQERQKDLSFYSADFSLEAHELSHLLGDTPHVKSDTIHILSLKGFSNYIPPEWCEKFNKSYLFNWL